MSSNKPDEKLEKEGGPVQKTKKGRGKFVW